MSKADLIRHFEPFSLLPESLLEANQEQFELVELSRKTVLYKQHTTLVGGLDIVLEGEVITYFTNNEGARTFEEILKPGNTYGAFSILLNNGKSIKTVESKTSCKMLRISAAHFKNFCEQSEPFYLTFLRDFGKEILNQDFSHLVINRSLDLETIAFDRYFNRSLEGVSIRPIISCSFDTPSHDAARLMESEKVSCIFVEENGQLIGYITDILLRNKIVAQQRHSAVWVKEVMEPGIFTVRRNAYIYEAILLMFQQKIRYLIVEEDGEYTGVISRSKLLSDQAQSPFVFIQSVRLALSIDELKTKWEQIPEVVYNLLTRGVKSELVNQVITNTSDTISRKVIEQVIQEIGEPPAKFTFMSLGSEGRMEQTLKTDQDNAIIYEDKANEFRQRTRDYFLDFAERVSSYLNAIGFSYCTGGLMAKNPKWTHSLSYWKRNYDEWIDHPADAQSIMNYSTFFDCRVIFGEVGLIEELQQHIVDQLENPGAMFFAQLANNALQYEPPLTFFKSIRTISKGDQKVFNIKHAMTPIVDLVRVYALKNKIITTNTGDRLQQLRAIDVLSDEDFHELMQSYYYLMGMRLKHQAHQMMYSSEQADNFINLQSLTKIEVVTLKEIFKVIENFQQRIKMVFTRSF